jgi:hypothetical protein
MEVPQTLKMYIRNDLAEKGIELTPVEVTSAFNDAERILQNVCGNLIIESLRIPKEFHQGVKEQVNDHITDLIGVLIVVGRGRR